MILKRKPQYWFDAVICYCFMHDGTIILLQKRNDNRYYPGLWGIPGGKVEPGEDPTEAIVREIEEETGNIVSPGRLRLALEKFLRHKIPRGTFYRFRCLTFILEDRLEKIIVNPKEHQKYCSVHPDTFMNLDRRRLIPDELEIYSILQEIGAI